MKHLGIWSAFILVLAGTAFLVWQHTRQAAQATQQNKRAAIVNASDYPSLQAALDAVPELGGIVQLPPGTINIEKPLIVTTEDTRIIGSGAATHIKNRNEDGQPAFILRPKEYPKRKGSRIWRVQLADFRISGNPKSGDGVLAQGINEIYIHGMSIDHNGGHGINLVDCYEDPRVCDSILTYNKVAGLNILRGHDIVVNGNQFEENLDALRCIDSFNLCMDGNNLDDHLQHGVVIENTYGSVLSGNMIEECKGTAIVMDRDCYGNTVSANVIAHNFSGGVHLKDAWGCAVSANTFTIVDERGVEVGPKSGRITISANSFSNSWIGGKTRRSPESPSEGIVLDGTKDITITGNSFTGLSGAAVLTKSKCTRLAITGNVAADLNRKNKGQGLAWQVIADETNVIANNVVEKGPQP